MENKLFREKSIKKIESPESLNDYIRITGPRVWILIVAVLVILIGFVVWGIFGKIETRVTADAVFENGISTCTVTTEENLKTGMEVNIGDKTGEVTAIKYKGDKCTFTVKAPVKDGKYNIYIVTESISPITFAVN